MGEFYKSSMVKNKKILVFILVLAALLRFINLSSGDPLGDEMLYAFRAVGPMDFDVANKQSTPWEWLAPSGVEGFGSTRVPFWARLSWHDHPPLVFWIQHIFIKLFGENNFAFRFPSTLLGVLSVWLIYLIGRRLFYEKAGLISAFLMAVTVNNVFISRVGLQESYVIFFILLTLFLFLKSLENSRYLILMGMAVGLGGLTKYTTFIVVPIIFTYLLIYKRSYFKDINLWLGVLVGLIIFSPVIIYNIGLYKNVGHFDFQLSYILNQHPKEWLEAPGKEEIGSLDDRVKDFIPNLVKSNSYVLLMLFAISIFWIKSKNRFLFIWLVFQVSLFLLIGPTRRFLTMLTPTMVLTAGNFISKFNYKYILVPVIIFELFYSLNSHVINFPWGREVLAYSPVRQENYNWGYNELEKFFSEELKNKYPKYVFDSRYKFIETFQSASVEQAKEKGDSNYNALIVYDESIYETAQLWILDRRQIYHGWPVIKSMDYLTLPEKNVFKNNYLIIPTVELPLRSGALTASPVLEKDLLKQGISPIIIKNNKGIDIFKIYLW